VRYTNLFNTIYTKNVTEKWVLLIYLNNHFLLILIKTMYQKLQPCHQLGYGSVTKFSSVHTVNEQTCDVICRQNSCFGQGAHIQDSAHTWPTYHIQYILIAFFNSNEQMQTCYLILFSQIVLQLIQQSDTHQNTNKNLEICIGKHITHRTNLNMQFVIVF
jgi:hypothetical protein